MTEQFYDVMNDPCATIEGPRGELGRADVLLKTSPSGSSLRIGLRLQRQGEVATSRSIPLTREQVTLLIAKLRELAGKMTGKASPGVFTPEPCPECGKHVYENYMLRDIVWERVAAGARVLHLRCVEKRLGRRLAFADFDMVNRPRANAEIAFGYELGQRAAWEGTS